MVRILTAILLVMQMLFPSGFRVDKGVAVDKCYIEENDCYNMGIETSDGNYWTVSDYVLPLNTDCVLVFDMNGTPEVEDDIIKTVIAVTEF